MKVGKGKLRLVLVLARLVLVLARLVLVLARLALVLARLALALVLVRPTRQVLKLWKVVPLIAKVCRK
jgi:hypothetical protein